MNKFVVLLTFLLSADALYAETREEILKINQTDSTQQATKSLSRVFIKKYGKPLEKQGIILLRKGGINKEIAVNTVLITRALAEQKVKYKIKLGNNYSINGLLDNNTKTTKLLLIKRF